MNKVTINSDFRVINHVQAPTFQAISETPNLIRVSTDFAIQHGGAAVRRFIQSLPIDWAPNTYQLTVLRDRLRPGYHPTAPGFHVDGEIGSNYGLATFLGNTVPTEHVICCMGEEGVDIDTTEFVVGPLELEVPEIRDEIRKGFGWWHFQIESELQKRNSEVQLISIPPNSLAKYNHHAFHRSPKARTNGNRVLCRASRVVGRLVETNFANEVMPEDGQAYITTETGWERVAVDEI